MYAIGVDLGGTKTAAGVVSGDGELLFSDTIPTLSRDGSAAILDATASLVAGLVRRADDAGITVKRVGVGSAGVIDAARGVVASATDAIAGWAGTALTAGLAARLDLPASSVLAVNDVHAHALGEAWTGAAAGTSSSLLVAFGTGVGGSFVLDGAPVLGHRYAGGHVGHFASPYACFDGAPLPCVCGGAGHVEAIASGPAIREAYVRLGGSAPAADTRAVFGLAGSGDAIAARAIAVAAAAAGQAVGGLANILDPEVVLVSGGLADAGERWRQPMEAALRAELLPALTGVPVRPAALGNTAAIVGAARLVLEPADAGCAEFTSALTYRRN
ncbi:ROK family protein [Pseudarthrobacter chlorophenolicus A6]|uniref:ROK family protein n=1 Tax=Pseudarthrobacter chlorophenolicus (strain ATCC 700700 / DSM 12829 / CIP 107037 / JCM 12360 / KCTC 9906 / NCIMB 13794 / A6) TaxID=452863 RepID=B8HGT3_PSECP|nr:ROK family protein [Pseudarthrobacter chlorophenolicus]ACL41349.1 ROK family protein [Pseudarthrobacter chlorophenolicus A6]SDQ65722.1 glucokinase [Pseudarthrobacter chlorophenolicus]